MSLEWVTLSFFKENNIDYYLDHKQKLLMFSCFHCGRHAVLKTNNTSWICKDCENEGNLHSLILLLEQPKENITSKSEKLYNPTKERRKIRALFRKLIRENEAISNELGSLFSSVEDLIIFTEK